MRTFALFLSVCLLATSFQASAQTTPPPPSLEIVNFYPEDLAVGEQAFVYLDGLTPSDHYIVAQFQLTQGDANGAPIPVGTVQNSLIQINGSGFDFTVPKTVDGGGGYQMPTQPGLYTVKFWDPITNATSDSVFFTVIHPTVTLRTPGVGTGTVHTDDVLQVSLKTRGADQFRIRLVSTDWSVILDVVPGYNLYCYNGEGYYAFSVPKLPDGWYSVIVDSYSSGFYVSDQGQSFLITAPAAIVSEPLEGAVTTEFPAYGPQGGSIQAHVLATGGLGKGSYTYVWSGDIVGTAYGKDPILILAPGVGYKKLNVEIVSGTDSIVATGSVYLVPQQPFVIKFHGATKIEAGKPEKYTFVVGNGVTDARVNWGDGTNSLPDVAGTTIFTKTWVNPGDYSPVITMTNASGTTYFSTDVMVKDPTPEPIVSNSDEPTLLAHEFPGGYKNGLMLLELLPSAEFEKLGYKIIPKYFLKKKKGGGTEIHSMMDFVKSYPVGISK